MTHNTSKISIANLNLQIDSNDKIIFSKNILPFISVFQKADVYFYLKYNKCKLNTFDKFHRLYKSLTKDYYVNDGQFYIIDYDSSEKKYINWISKQLDNNHYEITINGESDINAINPLIFTDFSKFLIDYNSIILHASLIKYKNLGILFSAPSGTGKSTQANLWEKYCDATIINGDRAIIKKEKDYVAYGSPFAGSSYIYKNEHVNISCIVILRQSKSNQIYTLTKKEAFLCLLSETLINNYDKNIISRQTTFLFNLIEDIPIYMLKCRPDKNSVFTLLAKLEGDLK